MSEIRSARPDPVSRRTIVLSAAALVAVLIAGIMIVVVSGDDSPTGTPTTLPVTITTPDGSVVPAGQNPSIIPDPSQGQGPTEPGDPGSAEQLGLLAVLLVALIGIGVVVFRGSRKTQARRAQWLAAANEPERSAAEERS